MKINLFQGSGLTSRVGRSSIYVMLGNVGTQFLRLISNLVLTRLLFPEMFGVMAIAQVFIFILVLISDIGIQPCVIRSKRGDDPRFVNTAWTMQILQSFCVAVLVSLAAMALFFLGDSGVLPGGSVYSDPQLPSILLALAASSFLLGFKSVDMILANRKLQLGKLAIIEVSAQLINIFVMIILAYFYRSIWSLVAGGIAANICIVFLSHTVFRFSNLKFQLEKESVSELFNFGKWLLASSVMTAFLVQGDRIFLGWVATAEILGIYNIAFFLITASRELLIKIANSVFLPALSEVSRDREGDLVNTYYKIRRYTDFLSMLIAGVFIASGQVIIEILYDPRYVEAGWMMQVMGVGLIFSAPIISSPLMLAIGKSKYEAVLRFFQMSLLFISLPLFHYFWGFVGVVIVLSFIPFCSAIIDIVYRSKNGLFLVKKEFLIYPVVIVGYIVGLIFNSVASFVGIV